MSHLELAPTVRKALEAEGEVLGLQSVRHGGAARSESPVTRTHGTSMSRRRC
eukprot:COSAG01_NODE_46269_length_401_cov_1.937086_1_plen_51_part_01